MTGNVWVQIIAAFLGSNIVVGLTTLLLSRKKFNAEIIAHEADAKKATASATAQTVEAVLKWANMLTLRIDKLENSLTQRDVIITDLKTKVIRMEMMMVKNEDSK